MNSDEALRRVVVCVFGEGCMTSDLTGTLLLLRYVPLDQALTWLWAENPKRHDLDRLADSIRRYGFRDPSIYDATLGGIPAGNGRLLALEQLRDRGEPAPAGVGISADGTWCVPLVFGVDAASRAAAEAFGLDHNNLTLAGGNFSAFDVARLWSLEAYLALLRQLEAEDATVVTVDDVDLQRLIRQLEGGDIPDVDEPDSLPDDFKCYLTAPDALAGEIMAYLDSLTARGVRWERR